MLRKEKKAYRQPPGSGDSLYSGCQIARKVWSKKKFPARFSKRCPAVLLKKSPGNLAIWQFIIAYSTSLYSYFFII
jgi:hypothetical protein